MRLKTESDHNIMCDNDVKSISGAIKLGFTIKFYLFNEPSVELTIKNYERIEVIKSENSFVLILQANEQTIKVYYSDYIIGKTR